MKIINVFTDGATPGNNKKLSSRLGGYGVFFEDNHPLNISQPYSIQPVTNNKCELEAIYQAIKTVVENEKEKFILHIYSDSKYCIDCFTKFCKTWESKNWVKVDGKQVLNVEQIKSIYEYVKHYPIFFHHVRSHKNEPSDIESKEYFLWYGNMMADKLATSAATSAATNCHISHESIV